MKSHIYEDFPCLVPIDEKQNEYYGHITIKRKEYKIYIRKTKNDSEFRCSWELSEVLKDSQHLLEKRLEHANSVHEFLVELSTLVERVIPVQENTLYHTDFSFYNQVLVDLLEIGWKHVLYINDSLSKVTFNFSDDKSREHNLTVNFLPRYPKVLPEINCCLPVPFVFSNNNEINLPSIVYKFKQTIESCQEFWDLISEVDLKTWVIEPKDPLYSDYSRRIALGDHCSLQIDVDPKFPRNTPEFRFLGPETSVINHRLKMIKNLSNWSFSDSLVTNIENILEIKLPPIPAEEEMDLSINCGACYSYRLESEIPELVCENVTCKQAFHKTCLYEWLKSVPSTQKRFNMLFGECPYCSKQMSMKIC